VRLWPSVMLDTRLGSLCSSDLADVKPPCELLLRMSVTSAVTHCRDMLDASPGVSWDDIAGLAEAKRVLQENVILPLYMPEYFQGIRRPVKVCTTRAYTTSAITCHRTHGVLTQFLSEIAGVSMGSWGWVHTTTAGVSRVLCLA